MHNKYTTRRRVRNIIWIIVMLVILIAANMIYRELSEAENYINIDNITYTPLSSTIHKPDQFY